MIFACDRCGRRYSVPDERVQGRAFRATCKACGNAFVVRPGAAAVPAAPSPAPPPQSAPRPPAPAPRPVEPSPAPAVSAPPLPPLAPPTVSAPPLPPLEAPPTPPAPPPQAPAPQPDAEVRNLSTDELAWLATGERPLPAPPAPSEPSEPPGGEPQGPGVLRLTLAAVVLGVAAAGAAWLLGPSPRVVAPPASPSPAPTVAVAERATPPPAPPPEPAPPPAAPPPAAPPPAAPSDPPQAADGPTPPAPEPAKATGQPAAAQFEPGAVTVAPSRKKQAHTLSKKDRKLLDLLARKADEAPPPEPVEKLDLDTGTSLDPAAVVRVVTESQGAFSGCISRTARASQGGDARRATLLLTVNVTGAVSSAWLAEAEVAKTPLGKCVVTAARRLVFPSFEGDPVDVSVPLVLEAR